MTSLKYSFLFLLTACSFSTSGTEIKFDNSLSSCFEIKEAKISYEYIFPALQASINELKSIGECGCKSLALTYSSFIQFSEYESHLMTGEFVTKNSSLSFPVATDKLFINDNKLLITLACAPPD